jgi:hypothetical protein
MIIPLNISKKVVHYNWFSWGSVLRSFHYGFYSCILYLTGAVYTGAFIVHSTTHASIQRTNSAGKSHYWIAMPWRYWTELCCYSLHTFWFKCLGKWRSSHTILTHSWVIVYLFSAEMSQLKFRAGDSALVPGCFQALDNLNIFNRDVLTLKQLFVIKTCSSWLHWGFPHAVTKGHVMVM